MKRPYNDTVKVLHKLTQLQRHRWKKLLIELTDEGAEQHRLWGKLTAEEQETLGRLAKTYLPSMTGHLTADVIDEWALEVKYIEGVTIDPATREVPPDAEVSLSDGGAWVQAWIWVSDDDAGINDEAEEQAHD